MKRKTLPTYRAEIRFPDCEIFAPVQSLETCLAIALSDQNVKGLIASCEVVKPFNRDGCIGRRLVVGVLLVSDDPAWSDTGFRHAVEALARHLAEVAFSDPRCVVGERIRKAVVVYDQHADVLEFDAEGTKP